MTSRRTALRAIKRERYKDRVKVMRKYFDGFEASAGFNLREPNNWTPAQKAKVTRYWEVMGIQVARPHVVKRFRKPERIYAAAEFSQQDRQLPGQRAVLIPVDDPTNISISFSKDNQIKVKRSGVNINKLKFNRRSFLVDPIAELRRVLTATDATVFKFMNGPHESRGVFTRGELEQRIVQIIAEYGAEEYDPSDRRSRHWKNWLTGLIPYSVKDADQVLKDSARYRVLADNSRKVRLRKKSRDEYRITQRARLTGRR